MDRVKWLVSRWGFWVVMLVLAGVAYHIFVAGSVKASVATAQATAERGVKLGDFAHERLDKAAEQMTSLKGEVDGKAAKETVLGFSAQVDKLAGRVTTVEEGVETLLEKPEPAVAATPPDEEVSAEPPVTVAEACKAEYTKLGFSSVEAQAACQ